MVMSHTSLRKGPLGMDWCKVPVTPGPGRCALVQFAFAEGLLGRFPRLKLIWADGAYAGHLVDLAYALGGWLIVVVKRANNSHSFEVLPRRWVVERTLGWLGRNRRLSKDYEALPESSEAWFQMAMINLMLKRLRPT